MMGFFTFTSRKVIALSTRIPGALPAGSMDCSSRGAHETTTFQRVLPRLAADRRCAGRDKTETSAGHLNSAAGSRGFPEARLPSEKTRSLGDARRLDCGGYSPAVHRRPLLRAECGSSVRATRTLVRQLLLRKRTCALRSAAVSLRTCA